MCGRQSADPELLIGSWSRRYDGGFPGQGPLYAAVSQMQPVTIVKKMVELGAIITSAVLRAAVRRQQVSSLEFLLKVGSSVSTNLYLEEARETRNEQIIALIETRARFLQKGERKLDTKRIRANMAKICSKTWWHIFSWKG